MIVMVNAVTEKGPSVAPAKEGRSLIVSQPKRLEGILMEISALQTESISEISAGGPGNSWSGGAQTGSGQRKSGPTPRDEAIAKLPPKAAMQATLTKHIEKEVHVLRSQARHITRINRPGAAHKLNELYARIRRLNALLGEILGAAEDVIKRIFIRVFIDRQSIL